MRNRIREVRREVGLTQVRVADMIASLPGGEEMDQSTLSKIESGERNPSVPMLFRIAEALGRPVADLLADQDNPYRLRDDSEAAVLEAFRDLPTDSRLHLLSYARKLVRAMRGVLTEAEWVPAESLKEFEAPLPTGRSARRRKRKYSEGADSA